MNLLEKYSKRLAVADKYFSDNHGGERLSESKKLTTAVCLDNIDKFLNESFNNSIGTQRADLGLFKKFCINLTNVALPSLIANDIVITKPMTSMNGVVAYIKYTAGSNKGMTKQGDLINSPFQHGKVDVDYTSAKIVTEAKTTDATGTLRWVEVVPGTVEFIVDGASTITDDGAGKLLTSEKGAAGTIDYKTGAYTLQTKPTTSCSANYVYDNVKIPQNDLPIINGEMDYIPLTARARRIAIYYSQMAA